MELIVKHIQEIRTDSIVDQTIRIKCDMTHRDMEDFIAQCWEKMGDEQFNKIIELMRD